MSSFLPPHSFPPDSEPERAELLAWTREVPLVYGAWTHWKSQWKAAEASFSQNRSEPEIWAALLSRTDAASLHGLTPKSEGIAAGSFRSLAMHPSQPLLYALRDDGYISILDISSPVQPRLMGSFRATESRNNYSYGSLRIVGDVLLHIEGEVRAFDLSQALEPQFLSSVSPRGSLVFPQNAGGETYLLSIGYNEQSTFQIPTRQNSKWTLLNKSVKDSYYGATLQSEGSLILLFTSQWARGNYSYEFSMMDASDPQNIVERGGKLKAQTGAFKLRGELMFQLNGKKFSVTDWSDASKAREIGKLELSRADGSALYVQGDVVVVVCGQAYYTQGPRALVFIDISQPQSPRVVGELTPLPWFPLDFARSGDIAFVATHQGLRALDMSSPSRASEVGQSPSGRTFAYLKRRGRRFGRILAQSDENASFELTTRLIENTRGQEALDFSTQWIVADALVGRGHAFEQAGHGRGAIVLRRAFHRRARLERVPGAWDAHREIVESWTGDDFPWQVAVVARRALGQMNAPISTKHLNAILRGDWPFALLEAARQGQSRLGELAPDALAGLLWCVNGRRRGEILRALGSVERKGKLATALANILARRAPNRGIGRRERELALLLAARFDLSHRDFSARDALSAVPLLLDSGEAPLRELGLAFCRRLSPEVALEAAKMAPRLEAELLPRFYQALSESARGGRFELEVLAPSVRHADERARRAVWAVVRGSKTKDATLRQLWTTLLRAAKLHYQYNLQSYNWELSPALQTALDSDDALAVLGRAGADASELGHLRFNEWQPVAPAALFGAWALFGDMNAVVNLVASTSAERWDGWKAAFVRALPFSPSRVGEFWGRVRAKLEDADFAGNSKDQLRARTFGDPLVAATFAGAVSALAPALLVGVIAGITDETWAAWRSGLLQLLQRDAARRQAFWDAVRANGFDDILRARLVDDADFAATFALLPSVLEFDEPALESLLLAWLQEHPELSSEDAVVAALHSLASVRDFGLRVLQERGLTTPLALHLVESRLPEPMRVAQNWFEQTAINQPERAVALALALLDSPLSETRNIGRTFVKSRLEALLEAGLLAALLENPNAEMQAFVADLLLKRDSLEPETRDFDRAVLRGRDRARRAKTLVQTRRAQGEALPDAQTLLELARGKTPRDADFAWTQLARLAQNEKVEGVEVSGVAAI